MPVQLHNGHDNTYRPSRWLTSAAHAGGAGGGAALAQLGQMQAAAANFVGRLAGELAGAAAACARGRGGACAV